MELDNLSLRSFTRSFTRALRGAMASETRLAISVNFIFSRLSRRFCTSSRLVSSLAFGSSFLFGGLPWGLLWFSAGVGNVGF